MDNLVRRPFEFIVSEWVALRSWEKFLVGGGAVAYALGYPLLNHMGGVYAGIFVSVPVAIVAWSFGLRVGVLAVLLAFLSNSALVILFSDRAWLDWIGSGGSMGFGLLLLVSIMLGLQRDMRDELKSELSVRKRVERELRQSEKRFRILAENIPAATIIYQGTRIRYANPQAQSLTGYSEEELLAMNFWDVIHPETRDLVRQRGMARQRGEPVLSRYEVKLLTKDGQERWVDVTALGIEFEGERAMVGTALDITERKRAEESLRESEERYRTLVESTDDGIFAKDAEGRYTFVNSEYLRRSIVRRKEDIIGKTVLEVIAGEQRQEIRKDDIRVLRTGQAVETENTVQTPMGQRSYLVRKIPIRDDGGKVVGLLGISRDITERKQIEEEVRRLNEELEKRVLERTALLEAANRELEAFTYSASHDLRAPLRAIDGFSRILLEEYPQQLSEEPRRYLQLVCESAQQMSNLIDDLLALSRMSRQPLNKQAVKPADLVRQSLKELRIEQEDRRVEVSIGDLPLCHADPILLESVFLNLLENALKFTRHRTMAEIQVDCREEGGKHVYFVKDNGVGFDMRYVGKLFGAFQRLHRAEEYEGTGVGLATVQRIVHRHGGRVWAEAEVDHGATFYFTLEEETVIG